MKSNYYKIYLNKVFQLAQTIVIKSSVAAETINQYVTDYHGMAAVVRHDPTTWKYYLNLSGNYHFTDEMMTVVSMDTLETVAFTRDSLAIHRATAREYAFGTRKYKELVNRFPRQEQLILGILYPVDIQTAIAARDGQILSYPKDLVESNEYSLIKNLQKWIDGYKIRWTNNQYGVSDELYAATSLGIMYLNLVPAILNLRLQACKTNEAHSFHIQQYLASHGMLDSYIEQLTKKQALFLYRNISYIERNNGKRATFEWLVEHIMSERGIPLAEYKMIHELSGMPESLSPEIRFRKKQLNLGYDDSAALTQDISQMLDKEDLQARDNMLYKDEHQAEFYDLMSASLSNTVMTKVLESSMVDYTNSTPYTLESTLLNHWLFLSTTGMYRTYIGMNNPRTGERVPLTAKDAYTFMWYAFCRSVNVELIYVPELFAQRVQRQPLPTAAQVNELVDSKLVEAGFAQEMINLNPLPRPIISTEAFYNYCVEVNRAENIQRLHVAKEEHMTARAMKETAVNFIYSDNICRTAPEGTVYKTWMDQANINIDGFTRDDFVKVYLELVKDTTGASLTTVQSVKAMQAAMVRLMRQLSSYSVQFITEINDIDIKPTDWTAVRVGDNAGELSHAVSAEAVGPEVLRTRPKIKARKDYDVNAIGIYGLSTPPMVGSGQIDAGVEIDPSDSKTVFHIHVVSAAAGAHLAVVPQPNSRDIIPLPGIDSYLSLPAGQQERMKDIWQL